jgi:glucosamine--fructose-6-phosphate aminotransferase (isomerizing)
MMTHSANALWDDFTAQGENLNHVVEHLYGPERARLDAAGRALSGARPLIFIGVASAAYLCLPATVYLSSAGRVASVVYASDALYYTSAALRHADVVICSRSGETAEIVALARLLNDEGIPYVALTNEPESTLAQTASHIVWTDTRKDDLVSINVVTGMMAGALALAAAALGRDDAMQADLRNAAAQMPAVVERSAADAPDITALLGTAQPIHLLWRGPAQGAALCGRLVLEEVARTPAVPLDAAEFRQGPNEVVDDRFAAALFMPAGQPGALNRTLAAEIARRGGRVLLIGEATAADAASDPERLRAFPIHGLPDFVRPILEVVPLQALAYHLAQAQGYAPGEVRYITKVIVSEDAFPVRADR